MFEHFYHERIRKSVGAFGSLFNDMYIVRRKKSSGNRESVSQVKVPLSYAPRRKFLERLNASDQNELNDQQVVALQLPRMSFEIISLTFDPARMVPKTNFCRVTTPTGAAKVYAKTPYNISFSLNIYAKTQDDAIQVVEQILPYFKPSYTLTMRPLPDYPNIKDDIPLTLLSVSFSDNFDGAMEDRRAIVWTLDFEMKIDFYGPINTGKVIKQVDAEFFLGSGDSGFEKYSTLSVAVDPKSASEDSDYTIVETIEFARDSDG
jgi:hypothetical protein